MNEKIDKILEQISEYSGKVQAIEKIIDTLRGSLEYEMRMVSDKSYKNDLATVSKVKKTTVKYDKDEWIKFCEENNLEGFVINEKKLTKELDEMMSNKTLEIPDFVEAPKFEVIEKESLAIRFNK